jgi:hypothetical protein
LHHYDIEEVYVLESDLDGYGVYMKIDITFSSFIRLEISVILNLHGDTSGRNNHLATLKRLHERVKFFT